MFSRRAKTPTVSPDQAANRPAGVLLLDVREIDEWTAGHAPDAHHLPLSTLDPASVPEADTVYCVCRSGGRSAQATTALRAAGRDAHNVDGGMNTWIRAGLPVITNDGAPGAVT